jgi:hypothetical protein
MNRLNPARAWKTVAAALFLCLAASAASAQKMSTPAKAPTPAMVDLARQILTASGESRALDPLIPSVMQQTYTNFVQQNPDLQKPLVETMTALQPEFMKLQSQVTDLMANAYAAHFTEAELKEMLAFYNSPTGKKYVAEMPKVMQESLAAAREWGAKFSDKVIARVREEMKKKGHNI